MIYPKIETLFERKENFGVDINKIKNPVYEIIKTWQVTEKIDGTNIRVMLQSDGTIRIGGRTDAAQIHADLVRYLYETFPAEKLRQVFWKDSSEQPFSVILYGEGYGAGIQKGGGNYNPKKVFRLFDVAVAGKEEGKWWWLNWENVCDVAKQLNIRTVPYLGLWTLDQIVQQVKSGIKSVVAIEDSQREDVIAEGVVGRTAEPLFDKRGNRLILKLKTKDFK